MSFTPESRRENEAQISEQDRKMAGLLLKNIENLLAEMERGDEYVSWADSADDCEAIDDILGGLEWYRDLKEIRVRASYEMMQGSDDEKKKSGMNEARRWIEGVRPKL